GRHISGAGKLAGLAGGIFVGVATGNPFPAIAAAVDFVAWVNGVWQESNQKHASSQRPTQTVSEFSATLWRAAPFRPFPRRPAMPLRPEASNSPGLPGAPRAIEPPCGSGRRLSRTARKEETKSITGCRPLLSCISLSVPKRSPARDPAVATWTTGCRQNASCLLRNEREKSPILRPLQVSSTT